MPRIFLLLLALAFFPASARANCVVGATGVVGTGTCAKAGMVLIGATQTISNASSIQWTGLSGYDNYRMYCEGVYPATNSANIVFQFGEGATVWETSNYVWAGLYNTYTDTYGNSFGAFNDTSVQLAGQWPNTAAYGLEFVADFFNLPSTVETKRLAFVNPSMGSADTTKVYNVSVSGLYYGDLNPITAIRIIANTGNINGKCSIYGIIE